LAPTPTPTRTPRPTAAPTGTPAPTSSALVVARIVDFAFSPQTLTVARGSSVRWTNADVAPHTVTAGDGSFASGTLAQNATFTRAFPIAGTFAYRCAIHPSMTGTVVVTP
jgi:plastocyanin